MRRLIALALFLYYACALASPILAQSTAQPESRILLCCRHGGDHHCMAMTATDAPTVRPHCPALDPAASTPAPNALYTPPAAHEGPLAALTPAPPLGSVAQPPSRSFQRIPARGPPQA